MSNIWDDACANLVKQATSHYIDSLRTVDKRYDLDCRRCERLFPEGLYDLAKRAADMARLEGRNISPSQIITALAYHGVGKVERGTEWLLRDVLAGLKVPHVEGGN